MNIFLDSTIHQPVQVKVKDTIKDGAQLSVIKVQNSKTKVFETKHNLSLKAGQVMTITRATLKDKQWAFELTDKGEMVQEFDYNELKSAHEIEIKELKKQYEKTISSQEVTIRNLTADLTNANIIIQNLQTLKQDEVVDASVLQEVKNDSVSIQLPTIPRSKKNGGK
jgi:hypothetical protein